MAIVIKCKDGDCQVPDMIYQQSALVRDFCNSDSCKKWSAERSLEEVFEHLQELMWK